MILADTSVWIAHFRQGSDDLKRALEAGEVVCHWHAVGELACGNPRSRDGILELNEVVGRPVLVGVDVTPSSLRALERDPSNTRRVATEQAGDGERPPNAGLVRQVRRRCSPAAEQESPSSDRRAAPGWVGGLH